MDLTSPAFQQLVTLQVELFKVLANRTRLSIVYLLKEGDLVPLLTLRSTLGVSKANLSQHLSILKNAGIIELIPEGRKSSAQLKSTKLVEACAIVRQLLKERVANDMKPFMEDNDLQAE